jgi:ATP-dependent Clp protease protease subunit
VAARKNDSFYNSGLDMDRRLLYLGSISNPHVQESGVDFAMAEVAIRGLMTLDAAAPDGDKPITIVMNNPGGEVYHGMAIYDAIKSCKNYTTILVYGHAMSMGSIILQAADERILAPHATVMIHVGTDGAYDHAENFQRRAVEGRRMDKITHDILLARIREKHPKFTEKKMKKLLDFDTYLDARAAVDLGLADGIIGDSRE